MQNARPSLLGCAASSGARMNGRGAAARSKGQVFRTHQDDGEVRAPRSGRGCGHERESACPRILQHDGFRTRRADSRAARPFASRIRPIRESDSQRRAVARFGAGPECQSRPLSSSRSLAPNRSCSAVARVRGCREREAHRRDRHPRRRARARRGPVPRALAHGIVCRSPSARRGAPQAQVVVCRSAAGIRSGGTGEIWRQLVQ